MERLLSFAVGVAAVAVVIAASVQSPGARAAAPRPTPVALQYEEITRFVFQATPEPPGFFQEDRQTIVAAASAPAPQHHGIFGGIMNSVQTAMNAMQSLRNGILTRYTYYNGWIRTDDVAAQTATIEKCNLNQYIKLDLAHQTYSIESTLPSPEPAPAPAMPGGTTTVSAAPGTMDLTVTATGQNLGPRTIEGFPTHGDSASITMAMTHATGSCRNGSMSMQVVEYVSGLGVPRAYCPLPRVSGMPVTPQQFVVRGGCVPHIHGSASGMFESHGSSNRLAMYRFMTFGAGSGGQSGSAGALTEAGNVQWLYRPQAEALFSIPAGFTRTQ
jgi:hypothetical protein